MPRLESLRVELKTTSRPWRMPMLTSMITLLRQRWGTFLHFRKCKWDLTKYWWLWGDAWSTKDCSWRTAQQFKPFICTFCVETVQTFSWHNSLGTSSVLIVQFECYGICLVPPNVWWDLVIDAERWPEKNLLKLSVGPLSKTATWKIKLVLPVHNLGSTYPKKGVFR